MDAIWMIRMHHHLNLCIGHILSGLYGYVAIRGVTLLVPRTCDMTSLA